MAKPNGIILTSKGKYKVTLEYEGKKIFIGNYKTLDAAKEALDNAKRQSGT